MKIGRNNDGLLKRIFEKEMQLASVLRNEQWVFQQKFMT